MGLPQVSKERFWITGNDKTRGYHVRGLVLKEEVRVGVIIATFKLYGPFKTDGWISHLLATSRTHPSTTRRGRL